MYLTIKQHITQSVWCNITTSKQIRFVDINECSDPSLHNCLSTNFVKCVNLDHGFQCVCVNNFYVQIEQNRCIGETRRHGHHVLIVPTVADIIHHRKRLNVSLMTEFLPNAHTTVHHEITHPMHTFHIVMSSTYLYCNERMVFL